jgi:probable rRNA maturation factor
MPVLDNQCIVMRHDDSLCVSDDIMAAAKAIAQKTIEMEELGGFCEAFVIMADDELLGSLNQDFRGIAQTTDVLSFPENDLHQPLAVHLAEGLSPQMDESGQRMALGEIYISVQQAARQAEEYGNTLEQEVCFLTVHGILHLLGYDHMQPDDEAVMRNKQRRVLGRQ